MYPKPQRGGGGGEGGCGIKHVEFEDFVHEAMNVNSKTYFQYRCRFVFIYSTLPKCHCHSGYPDIDLHVQSYKLN